ncbi:MAG: AraC family transcriptional regulator, partial [Spirochaetia bacterium]|nr:AraC family transcriptional regulator [Spirochaetia bacterium]
MQVEILLLPDAPASVVTGLCDFFEIAGVDLEDRRAPARCSVRTVSLHAGSVNLHGRVAITPDVVGLSDEPADLVIVP